MNDRSPDTPSNVLTSTRNPQVLQVRRWLSRARECRQDGVVIADGVHVVQEAFHAGLECRELFLEHGAASPLIAELRLQAEARGDRVQWAAPHVFRALSPVETPQGVLGVFARPDRTLAQVLSEPVSPGRTREPDSPNAGAREVADSVRNGPVVVAVELQDPTNLGAIARSALALGARGLITTENTVDPFHPRSIRASMGALFHLPTAVGVSALDLVDSLRSRGFGSAGLSTHGGDPIHTLREAGPLALFLGAEGAGLHPSLESSLDRLAHIPIAARVESLGVAAAAAIALYALRDSRH